MIRATFVMNDCNTHWPCHVAIIFVTCAWKVFLEFWISNCYITFATGVATNQRATCPICRQPFPVRLISQPSICEDFTESCDDEAEVWFYEGQNGWWQYDERTNRTIGTLSVFCPKTSLQTEDAHKKGDTSLEVLIAGHFYTIDFEEAVQYQAAGNLRRRKIKREKLNAIGQERKGTAGVPKNELDLGLLRWAPMFCFVVAYLLSHKPKQF